MRGFMNGYGGEATQQTLVGYNDSMVDSLRPDNMYTTNINIM